MQNDNQPSPNSQGSNTTETNGQKTHRNRRRPRRDGKGSNVARHRNQSSSNITTITGQVDAQHDVITDATDNNATTNLVADEAAIAEGGLKTVGNQRLLDFMKLEKPMGILSILLVFTGLFAIFFNGLNLGLDFTGGVSADVVYEQPVQQSQITDVLAQNGFTDAVVQYVGANTDLLVRLPPQDDNTDGLEVALNHALDLPNNNAEIANINIIGSQVGNDIYIDSVMALALALACMLVYVAIRFQFKLALGAVLALFHDTVVTLGVFALFGWPFDLTVLAAVLALIGYSLNDTIVVYDRIRENFRRVRDLTPKQVLNLSLTETLRRTVMTVGTVLVVVLAMMFLGGDGLYWFSVALFIGLIAGTYSSIYIASSIPLRMGLSRDDFVVKVKPEFEEEVVSFQDPKAFSE